MRSSVQVDVDEISSGQRMIFMVSAYGTAVKCKKNDLAFSDNLRISGDFLNKKINTSIKYNDALQAMVEQFQSQTPDVYEHYVALVEEIMSENITEFIEQTFVRTLIYAAICKERFDVFSTDIREVLNAFQKDKLAKVFLDEMLQIATQKDLILTLRNVVSYPSLCQYFSGIIPLTYILDYMEKGNDYFYVIIIFPLLKEFKDYYDADDINLIANIITKLKETYWNESLTLDQLNESMRICVCGDVLLNGTPCHNGHNQSINVTTYQTKVDVVKHLSRLYEELQMLFV